MQALRRTISWIAVAAAWSCGGASVTGVDAAPGGVSSIAVSPSSITLSPGGEAPLQATVLDGSGHPRSDLSVVWSVKDSSIARISSSGVVSARAVGNTQIAASAGGVSAIATLTVQPPPVASVVVQPLTQALVLGQGATFTATPRDVNGAPLTGRVVTWTSSNEPVATVSQDGRVTSHAVGSATITATSEGVSGSATVTVSPVPVASVSVQPASATLTVGATLALAAQPKDANDAPLERAVSWSSDNPAVASVSATGVITALAAGSATIAAQSEGKTGTATITVSRPAVASVAIAPASASLVVGGALSLSTKVKDAAGTVLTDRVVTWSSSAPAVATVSASGLVTALTPGSAIITATSEGANATASIVVSRVPVGSVIVLPTSASVTVGQTAALTATVHDSLGAVATDRVVTWTSSDIHVAIVSTSGVVTGVTAGTAVISATSEGKTGTSTVTVVVSPVGSVTVQPTTASVHVGGTTTLTATVKDAGGAVVTDRPVTWASSNVAVATVSATGVVTGRATGTATISATSGGRTGNATVSVVPVPVGSVAVTPPTATLVPAQVLPLNVVVRDANDAIVTDRAVTWTSSNSAVATVSANGIVTAVGLGTATVTATSEGKSGTSTITVVPMPVGSVTVAPSSASVTPGGTVSLSATVRDTSGAVVTGRVVAWSSSDPMVATVSSSGVVTGVNPGSVIITAASEGKSGHADITVLPVPVASLTLAPTSVTLNPGQTAALTATTKSADGTVLTGRAVRFSSDNTGVASVSSDGVVTAHATGTAIITATSEGKNGSATITVVPVPVGSVTVAPSAATLVPTQVMALSAVVRDTSNAVVTDRVVTWASSNSTVATVSATGVVTAVAPGSATITATSEGKTGTASISVVPMPVASVTVSPPTANVTAGQTVTLSATVRDTSGAVATDRVVTWQSSNTAIATVSAAGVVTGVSEGTVTITATSDTASGSAAVTVQPAPVATVTLDPTSVTLEPGQTATLFATTKSADGTVLTGRTVTFSSNNVNVAQVSNDGVVTAVAPGSATITATSEGKTATATVTVQPTVAYVVVSPNEVFLRRSGTVQLSATAYDAANNVIVGRAVTWSTSDDHLATVSDTGLVTARRTGTVTITATIDGKSGTARVTITN